jgi:hypothetical protein
MRDINNEWLAILNTLVSGLEAIADPWLGCDVSGGVVDKLQLLAQMANKNAQVFGLFDTVRATDGCEESAMSNDLARVFCEVDE